MNKIKILYVITGLHSGGAERQFFNLVTGVKKNLEIEVVNFYGGIYEDKLKWEGINVTRVPVSSEYDFGKAIKGLKEKIEQFKPDIVHSFLPHANILAKWVKITSKHKFKLMCSVRGRGVFNISQHIGERLLDSMCDQITTNSLTIKRFLTHVLLIKGSKIQTIYNGYNFKQSKRLTLHPKKKKIITVANYTREKDFKTNIKTCAELLKLRNDFIFLYVGEGERMRKFKEYATKLGAQEHIDFMGRREDVPELLSSSDVFFLPTLTESQSNAVIEAMHYGCPVVTTDISANKEIIKDGKEGLLLPKRRSSQMAHAINRLLDDKKLYKKIKSNAQKKSATFTMEKMVQSYLRLYRRMV